MELRLIYQGQLVSSGNRDKKGAVKNAIRKQVSDQLFSFWKLHPILKQHLRPHWNTSDISPSTYHPEISQTTLEERDWPIPQISEDHSETMADAFGRRYERGIPIVPLVNKEFGFVCSLDILFLRPELPGQLFTPSGDIDNRIKTLLDALKVPVESDKLSDPALPPLLFCLLADDALVTDLNITTDRLYTPPDPTNTHPDSHVHLVIKVRVKSNTDFISGMTPYDSLTD